MVECEKHQHKVHFFTLQIMWASAQARRGDPLTKKLRDFSVKYVKITNEDMARSRSLVQEVIEKQVMSYCERNSLIPILRRE